MPVGMETGSVQGLDVTHEGKLIFVKDGDVSIYDPHEEEPELKSVLSGVRRFALSADGKKIMVNQGQRFAVR